MQRFRGSIPWLCLALVAGLVVIVIACDKGSPTVPSPPAENVAPAPSSASLTAGQPDGEPEAGLEPGVTSKPVPIQQAAKGGQPKIVVCHQEGNGGYHIISVAEPSWPAHEGHGDWLVAEEICDGIDNDCDGEVDELDPLDLSYYFSWLNLRGTATVLPGDTFTIWDQPGGCGPVFRDTAECRTNCLRQVRAYYHDCLSGAGPGTLGPWVSAGCSTAEEFGFVVECCVP